ncbi:DinB family protein [Winogradskyella haliclonae]|uniref:DinB family protein n=1 Tax=Winogradskyella haliclonae TaxID=2048558 RepID=A0ABQ2BY22_9FLAO|nr:DinB family protein [Winogradskyella haliclonae]GGI56964.1 hypothetical protein GCM10011444_12730 [Winogradskyella haliclonae]
MKNKILYILLLLTWSSYSQKDSLAGQILKTWNIHNSMNLKLIEGIDQEYLDDYYEKGERNVGQQFNHIIEVRLQWLKELFPKDSLSFEKIVKQGGNDKPSLIHKLKESAQLVETALEKGLNTNEGNWVSMNPIRFFGYLISHESHQRGQIILSLKQSGHELSPNITYGIWNW